MTPAALTAEYANLRSLHDALAVLEAFKLISAEDKVSFIRKFMSDRPQFTAAVAEALKVKPEKG